VEGVEGAEGAEGVMGLVGVEGAGERGWRAGLEGMPGTGVVCRPRDPLSARRREGRRNTGMLVLQGKQGRLRARGVDLGRVVGGPQPDVSAGCCSPLAASVVAGHDRR
jgi:hypothetical protein